MTARHAFTRTDHNIGFLSRPVFCSGCGKPAPGTGAEFCLACAVFGPPTRRRWRRARAREWRRWYGSRPGALLLSHAVYGGPLTPGGRTRERAALWNRSAGWWSYVPPTRRRRSCGGVNSRGFLDAINRLTV